MMRIGHYQFSPARIPTLATILLLPVFISLGFWQLNRAEEKQAILDLRNERLALSEYNVDSIPANLGDIEYRKLSIKGRYLNQYQIYIDNKVHQGQVGYQIVTPLQLSGRDEVILVNRGWIKASGDRRRLPTIVNNDNEVTLKGTLKLNSKDIVTFLNDNNRLGTDWPALVRWVDPLALDKDIEGAVAPFLFLQDELPEDELKRQWHFINSSPEKSVSYAMQWFSFALLLLIIYVAVNLKRIKEKV